MNARRLTVALVFALTVSGLFTWWLSRKVASARTVPHNQRYIAAAKPLESGEVLKPASIQMVDWPANMPIQGAYAKPEDVVGRNVLYPLAQGEPILDRDLAAPGSGAGLTAKIPEGMRAVSFRSDEIVGVAGFLLPGTHVDVLETHRINNAPDPITTMVLQDVVVLAAGQKMEPDPEGKPTSVNVVTLLLKPEDAETAVLAATVGALHFVLRNGSDRAKVESPTHVVDVTLPKAHSTKARIASKSAPAYEVETVMGDKKIVNSFN